LHRKQIFSVFYLKKRTENKKNVKKRKNVTRIKKVKTFFTSMVHSAVNRVVIFNDNCIFTAQRYASVVLCCAMSVCPSVRPSQGDILSKQLNILLGKQRHMTA